MDDASTDGTSDILKNILNQHNSIRLISNDVNQGVAASRNTLINEAKGEFIAFYDDDDVSDPERIEKQYERIINYKKKYKINEPAICHTARLQQYENKPLLYVPTMGTIDKSIAPHGPDVAKRILYGKPLKNAYGACATCSQMGKTSDYRALGGFDESLRRSEDTDYNIRFALSGGHFVGISEPLVTQKMTYTDDKKLDIERQLMLQLLAKYQSFIDQYDSYDFCRKWLETKYHYLSHENMLFLKSLVRLSVTHPWQTSKRLLWSLPSLVQNRYFRSFHAQSQITNG